jgi:3-isopropylmalate/(R)-2-methylmalate dehydratase small subunit
MNIQGKVWVFGEDVNTDLIFPNKYKHVVGDDVPKSALYAMVGVDPEFPKKISNGDIIVAGKNFGCGSSREYAPLALKYAGISAVIAPSFGRIFFRNSINIGLLPLVCPESEKIHAGDIISVNLEEQKIVDQTSKQSFQFEPIPEFLHGILEAGGLIAFAKAQLRENGEGSRPEK